MRKSRNCLRGMLLLSGLLLLLLAPLSARAEPSSSDATISLVTAPTRPIAGEETRLTVTLKNSANGQSIANVSVAITAEKVNAASMGGHQGMSSNQAMNTRLTAVAKSSDHVGEYVASLKLPEQGDWKITVISGDTTAEFRITVIEADARASKRTYINRIADTYAVAFSMEGKHAKAGMETDFDLTVTDHQTGAPVKGLNIEVISVHMVQENVGGHDEANKSSDHEEEEMAIISAKEKKDAPGTYQVKAKFAEAGHQMMLVRLGTDRHELISFPVEVEGANDDDEAETSGPNYWFVGTVLGFIVVTIALVPVLRRRDLAAQRVEVS